MKEAEKRDFVNQILQLLDKEKETLTANGFNPEPKVAELLEKKNLCDDAEAEQQKVAVLAKQATTAANETLDVAYSEASNLVDIISGFLGKDNELVKQMRKYRN